MGYVTNFPGGIFATPSIGSGTGDIFTGLGSSVFFVDGDKGNDGNEGKSPDNAKLTIQSAVTAAALSNVEYGGGSTVYIKAKAITDYTGDPTSYAETVIIPFTGGERMRLIGASNGRTQGGLPQIKIGAGSTAMLTIRAPGCLIQNIGFNGGSSTGGGILLDDDYTTKSAFGTTIDSCHFKNCKGSTATNAATGGAIMWTALGNAWQVSITNNRFYKNVGDVVLKGNSTSEPQDVLIENNIFGGPAASVDCNLYLPGGMNGVIIRNNEFTATPAIGSGTNALYMDLTGCIGMLVGNSFATSTALTFGASGTGAKVPVTVFMPKNYRETTTGVSSEIFRT